MNFPFVLAWLARIVVGGLFVLAGVMKILEPLRFAEEIQAYRMVTPEITHAMAFVLPWVEVFAGALLILGPWRGEARFVIFAMTVVFTVAKVWAEARGLRISCGCFGSLLGSFEQSLSGVNGLILNVALCCLMAADYFMTKRVGVTAEPRISIERGNGEAVGSAPRRGSASS